MRRALALVLGCAMGLGSLCASVPARADDVQLEQLRKRFREGMALEADEKWSEALRIFNEVAAQRTSAQVRFHIALCQENLGQLRVALEGFREALLLAQSDPSTGKEVLDNAPTRIRELSARVPRVSLVVAAGGKAEVLIDDDSIGIVREAKEIVLDPGVHTIAVTARGESRLIRELELAEGDRIEVEIPSETPAAIVPTKQVVEPELPDPAPQREGDKVPFYAVGSVGLAAFAGAGVMIGLRQLAIDEVRGSCADPDAGTGCDPSLQDVAERGRSYEYAAWGLAAGGAACLGVATILYFTIGQPGPAPGAPAGGSRQVVRVVVVPTPAGLSVRGLFE